MTDVLIDRLLRTVSAAFLSRLHSALDRHGALRYGERERRVGGQFGRKLGSIPEGHFYPVRRLHRNAFLWGCANFVRGEHREWLILGFGQSEGRRARIEHVKKLPGGPHHVPMAPADITHIHGYLDTTPKGAVVVVHNHPGHILHDVLAFLFGGDPMPSITDRDTALGFLLQRLATTMAGGEFGRIKFFLVQNDDVKEFSGTALGVLADWVRLTLPTVLGALRTPASSPPPPQ